MNPASRVIALDAYAAIRCPVKVHNYYDRTVQLPTGGHGYEMRGSSDLQQDLFGSRAIIDQILDTFAARPDSADLRGLAEEDWTVSLDATRDAIEAGVPVILGPRLPVDAQGHRRGSPPLLIRGADQADHRPGYLPVQVRAKRMLEKHSRPAQLSASLLSNPGPAEARPLANARLRTGREEEQLHLAHLWRLLAAIGWVADGAPLAGLIGNDALAATTFTDEGLAEVAGLNLLGRRGGFDSLALSWVPLNSKHIRTFSRTSADGWKERSPLERYDHEHSFRVKVAEVASRRTGASDDPQPMVTPIFVRECASCRWWPVCGPQLGDDDLSRRIEKSPLDVREISALRSLGVHSIHDLGEADLEALLPRYLPEVRHRTGAEERLLLAARRARMIATGSEIERIGTEAIKLPAGDLEIDWDIETSAKGTVYLWGFWLRRRSEPTEAGSYHSFVEFAELDEAAEIALAERALDWLAKLLADNPDAVVYHYSDYEIVHMNKLVAAARRPGLTQAAGLVAERNFDLFEVMRRHFFGAHGLGLKAVANAVAGFSWRDDSPGGLNSQRWFAEAVHSDDPQARTDARLRVLDYNEDDVRATCALRDWLRRQR